MWGRRGARHKRFLFCFENSPFFRILLFGACVVLRLFFNHFMMSGTRAGTLYVSRRCQPKPHNPSPKAHLHPALRWPRQVHRSGHPRLRSSFGEGGGGGLPHDFPCELRAGDFGLIFVGLYAECSTCQCYFCGGLAGFVSSSSVSLMKTRRRDVRNNALGAGGAGSVCAHCGDGRNVADMGFRRFFEQEAGV